MHARMLPSHPSLCCHLLWPMCAVQVETYCSLLTAALQASWLTVWLSGKMRPQPSLTDMEKDVRAQVGACMHGGCVTNGMQLLLCCGHSFTCYL